MSNIISLNVPPRRQRVSERADALLASFARHRRVMDDVFWLKENAEVLNILECTGFSVSATALEPHGAFYDTLPERLGFFRQYYRFLLSIGLDLEDLGLPGHQMEGLCAWTARAGLPEAELSDLQRAEARRLLARRGVTTAAADAGLDDRLRAFAHRPATFALPNKKAAYELTHIVFYLSEYGRKDPGLASEAVVSLTFAGLVAYLDQNMDLLAEVCVALRQAGQTPSAIWEAAVWTSLSAYTVHITDAGRLSDDYHAYLVGLWATRSMGCDDSGAPVPVGRTVFEAPDTGAGALRGISAWLMACAAGRVADWEVMAPGLYDMLDAEAAHVLAQAVESTPHFAAFFEGFARAGQAQA